MAALSAHTTQRGTRMVTELREVAPEDPNAALLAAENARLQAELRAATEELRRSRGRVAIAAAAERLRLERELHDRAQCWLVGLQIRLGLARERAKQSAPEIAILLAELGDQAESVAEELRRVAAGLAPALLLTHGLAEALRAQARFAGVAVRILADGVGRSDPDVELAVYLCCLEAIQNAAKHAGRDVHVTVRLSRHEAELTFSISDDGRGFESTAAEGTGLPGLRERIAALGGRLVVSSGPGRGSTVEGAVPHAPGVIAHG